MASWLPEDLVLEILIRLPPDEPVHLVRASLVCKSWRRVLSYRSFFLRRRREFHGGAPPPPPLLGYIQNRYYDHDAMAFVAATSAKPPARTPAVDYSRWIAVDCRHGFVLIHYEDPSRRGLVVWDPMSGLHQQLSVPPAGHTPCPRHDYTGAVLCAKHGCDHLDCQADDSPFRVVFVHTNLESPVFASANSYSSVSGAWSVPAGSQINHSNTVHCCRGRRKHSLLVGDVMYFAFEDTRSILKYDLRAHWLSDINIPRDAYRPFLMKSEDGGLGLASLMNNRIHVWSLQDVTANGIAEWVEQRVMEVGNLLPGRIPDKLYSRVVGFAEGTNTILINISTGIFTLDLKSKKVSKVGERQENRFDNILPYTRSYTLQRPS